MWLRRLVAIMMIIVCLGLNLLTFLGLVLPDKTKQLAKSSQNTKPTAGGVANLTPAPTISLTGQPTSIVAGSNSVLNWATTGNPQCEASGSWSGSKTPFGSESTGRIRTPGNYTYTITCTNSGGKAVASTTITAGNVAAPNHPNTTTTTPKAGTTYCGGRLPCYSKREVAAHGRSGDCWGWNGDRVINISGFDVKYHQTKSGISNIQISQICGNDLAPSLNGQVSAEGQSHIHNQTTKENADSNEFPYFVGYLDPNKP
jgi:uncharacterized membrane protein